MADAMEQPRAAGISATALAAAVASLGLASACSFTPAPSVPEAVVEVPSSFMGSDLAGGYEAQRWWEGFGDSTLNAVVDSVLESNFDLGAAVARVQQARARAGIARARLLPTVNGTGAASDQDTPSNTGFGQQIGDFLPDGTKIPDRFGVTTYSLGVEFAYEIDFWGRARNDAAAAGAEYLASESDYHAALIGVLSTAIATYFEIVDLRRRATLAEELVEVLGEREALAEERYERGLASALDLRHLRVDIRNAQSGLPQIRTQLVQAEGRLAALLGGYREKLLAILPASIQPTVTADPVAAGLPATLLYQRPDVRAAGQRLDAARFAIGARRAERLPSLSLAGSIGLQSADTDGLLDIDQWFRNLVGNLTAPIFQGGRIRKNIALAEARFREAAAAYGRTVVTAVHEVEGALAALAEEGRRNSLMKSRWEEARASSDLLRARYVSGIAGYGDYLDSRRALLGVESALAVSTRDLALARLAVHRSLGGDWTPTENVEAGDVVRMVPGHQGADGEAGR